MNRSLNSYHSKIFTEPDVVVSICNSSTWEAESRGRTVNLKPAWLHSETLVSKKHCFLNVCSNLEQRKYGPFPQKPRERNPATLQYPADGGHTSHPLSRNFIFILQKSLEPGVCETENNSGKEKPKHKRSKPHNGYWGTVFQGKGIICMRHGSQCCVL